MISPKQRLAQTKRASGVRLKSYPYEPDNIYFPFEIGNCSSCPECKASWTSHAYRMNRGDDVDVIDFYCGGGWWVAEDPDGKLMWVGRCGKPLVQKTIQFQEE